MAANGNNNWKPEKLEDICAQITDGKHGDCQDEADSGFYFLSCKDVANGKLNYDGARQITEADFLDTHRRTKFAPTDVLITNSGTIGRMAIAPDNELTRRTTFQKSVAILKPIASRVEPSFLYYALQGDIRRLIEFASGTAQKNLLLRDLRSFEVGVPSLPVQRQIAGILSAYDDLIENNTRRIQILERMAQTLYREWFVHFRFPGHAQVKLVASPLGKIPQGWQATRIGDVVETLGGGTPSTKKPAYWDNGTINWYSPSDLTAAGALFIAESSRKINELGLRESSAKLFPANCVMMTSRATIGVIAINTTPATTNQGFVTCIPNAKLCAYHIVEWIKQSMDLIIGVASGATFKEISRGEFRDLPIALPPENIERDYASTVYPMYQAIRVLLAKNANLRRTRDLLLPRLLSGELDLTIN